MADGRRVQHQPICKGQKLPVFIEEAIEDVLIVCLEAGAKKYRGVLVDSDKRNLPHGVCFPFKNDSKDDPSDNKSDITSVDGGVKGGEQNIQISAAALRHTYNQDFSQFGEKVAALTKRTYTRHFKDKTVRSIRLRPRQTLCSKCKSACHDNADPSSSSISKAPFSSLNNSTSSSSSSSYSSASNSLLPRIAHPNPPPPQFSSPNNFPLTTRNNQNSRNHSLIHNTRSRSPPVTRNRQQQQQQLQQQVPQSSSVVSRYCQPPPSPKTPRYDHPPPSPKATRYNQPPPSPKATRYNQPPPSPKATRYNQPPPSPKATRYNQPPPSPKATRYNQPPPSPKASRYNQPPPSPKTARYNHPPPSPKQHAHGGNQPPPSPRATRYNQPPPSPRATYYNQPPPSPKSPRYNHPPPSPKASSYNQPPPSPKPLRYNHPPPSPKQTHYNQPPMSPRNSRYSLPPPSSPKPPRFNQPTPSPKPPRFNQPPPSPRHLSSAITLPLPQPQVQLEPLKLGEHPETRSESRKRKCSVTEEYVPTTNDNKTNISLKAEGLTVVKSSPIIKISVGEGTVLKIPPRLHSEVVDTDQSSDEKLENKDYPTHKRLKKALKKAKEKLKRVDSENGDKISSGHHRKHKRKHKHKHACADIDRNLPTLAVEKANKEGENDSEMDAADPDLNDHQRPRLLYTWRRNSGLSRVESETSGNNTLSAGDLKNDEKSPQNPLLDNSLETKSDSSGESTDGFNSNSANGVSDSDSEYEEDYGGKEFSGSRSPAADSLKPLMMKIQTKTVTKVETPEGRIIHVGDIVWGKIQGFPWWPGRVLSITVSTRDNGVVIAQLAHVSWFGSSTMSHMQCVDLYPFLEDFKLRYNKKKRGPYKVAIKQATVAAKSFLGTSNIKVEDIEL